MRSAPAKPPRSAPLPEPALVTKNVVLACCAEAPVTAPNAACAASAKAEKRIVEFMSSSALPAAQPAVDRDHCSRHIVGEVSCEKLDHLGAILDGSEASQRHHLRPIAIGVAAARKNRLHDPSGGDDPRGNAVCGDAVRAEILRQIARVM